MAVQFAASDIQCFQRGLYLDQNGAPKTHRNRDVRYQQLHRSSFGGGPSIGNVQAIFLVANGAKGLCSPRRQEVIVKVAKEIEGNVVPRQCNVASLVSSARPRSGRGANQYLDQQCRYFDSQS
ncbi:hypothetical protein DOTSEDRAFT_75311 [Dothistroma septosporum NZE10]|uniref:Uncharacterized protein n=1 Tax=Dothistroma septosporum (strain NZE10 / CBS 128990) TaxID=675120 RepID=M2YKX4_DOTSN|nr:hypothetical protein DOTSEDRAFT_75311 [Dothistroma septosporum NZE10]